MITASDVERLRLIQERTSKLADEEDGYNVGDDVAWLMQKANQLNQELQAVQQFNALIRACLKATL